MVLNKTKCLLCNNGEKPLFKLPTDPNRLSSWLKIIQREDLLHTYSKEYIRNNGRLCGLHFKDEAFTSTLKLQLIRFAVPHFVKDSNKVMLTESLDSNSRNSLFLPESNFKPLERTNLSNFEIVEVDSSLKTNKTTPKKHKFMSSLSRPEIEEPFVTVITLCCPDRKEGITFHRFLQDPDQRMNWISAVKSKKGKMQKPSHIRVLCPKHFSADQTECHSAFKMGLKENAVPNTFPSDPLNLEKDERLFQMWKEVIPVDLQEITPKDEFLEFQGEHEEDEKIYVKVMWEESLSQIAKGMHSLNAGAITNILPNLPKHLPQTAKKQHLNQVNQAKKKLKKCTELSASDAKSRSVLNVSDNSGGKQMDIINSLSDSKNKRNICSPSDIGMKERNLIDSIETKSDEKIEPTNSISEFEEGRINLNNSHSDIELDQRRISAISPKILKVEGGIDPLLFQKDNEMKKGINYNKHAGSIMVPNEWWGITHTPQYIICSKWNEFYDSVFRVIIEKDSNVKIFIKGRKCANENRKVSFENISSLLQEVDSYKICAGIDYKSMTHCLGRLENGSQESFSIWCKECRKKGEDFMKSLR